MCLLFLLFNPLPIFFSLIVLCFSLYTIFSWILYPYPFQEVLFTDYLSQEIIYYNKIGLSLTLGVQILFFGLIVCSSCSYGYEATSMYPRILVYRKRCINVPLYISQIFLFTESVVRQYFLVRTSSPSTDSCSHQCQGI